AALALEAGDKLNIVGIDEGDITVLEVIVEPAEESSEEPAESSEEPGESSDEVPSDTGDTGLIAFGIIAIISLAGVVIARRRK
ncbi:MAG: LPXTG cell wall anchor domain-containing protein, partial [Clostridiales bacterium]|nr:LPXTG cell wall anchor domain-containing protein [Clostridiales bacterium]